MERVKTYIRNLLGLCEGDTDIRITNKRDRYDISCLLQVQFRYGGNDKASNLSCNAVPQGINDDQNTFKACYEVLEVRSTTNANPYVGLLYLNLSCFAELKMTCGQMTIRRHSKESNR